MWFSVVGSLYTWQVNCTIWLQVISVMNLCYKNLNYTFIILPGQIHLKDVFDLLMLHWTDDCLSTVLLISEFTETRKPAANQTRPSSASSGPSKTLPSLKNCSISCSSQTTIDASTLRRNRIGGRLCNSEVHSTRYMFMFKPSTPESCIIYLQIEASDQNSGHRWSGSGLAVS